MINLLEIVLLLCGLPLAMLLSGYWCAHRLAAASAAERLAVAVLGGLGLLLLNVSWINFVRPLEGVWAWLCLWPALLTVSLPGVRRQLRSDVSELLLTRNGALVVATSCIALAFLLWPVITRDDLVYFDGTSNHDAFFWISGAEHLKRNSYMEAPAWSSTQPLFNATPAIIGWTPPWGRMGAEGLLALTSSIVGLAPLKLYITATAALFIPWVAGVYLVLRTFYLREVHSHVAVCIIAFAPVFSFFYWNANLPNLLGALVGGLVVVATARVLRSAASRAAWAVFLVLGVHGLLCSYPEILPFVILPAGLIWLRSWFAKHALQDWRPKAACAAAWVCGLLVNPVTTLRAWHGFMVSFGAARSDQSWANLFESLTIYEYVPALATLAIEACSELGPWRGLALTILLICGALFALWRAKDRIDACLTLSGFMALLMYTIAAEFSYGWQKSVQFGGVLWAALMPAAVIGSLSLSKHLSVALRILQLAVLAVVVLFFAQTSLSVHTTTYRLSPKKSITQDWFSLREYAREHLRGAPVLVDGHSFSMAFFNSMWASYFLIDSHVYFAARGDENGGYLRDSVAREGSNDFPSPKGILVGRLWADTFDYNSPRLMDGASVALLANANRVLGWTGMYPASGIPQYASEQIELELLPHSPSTFEFEIAPRSPQWTEGVEWRVVNLVEDEISHATAQQGPPPWRFAVPLVELQRNVIRLEMVGTMGDPDPLPLQVRSVRITPRP